LLPAGAAVGAGAEVAAGAAVGTGAEVAAGATGWQAATNKVKINNHER